MSTFTELHTTRQALRDLARVVQSTRQMLSAIISQADWLGNAPNTYGVVRQSRPQSGDLSDALSHLEEVREGFILSHRTDTTQRASELHDLVAHVLMDWDWLHQLNLSFLPSIDVDALDQQLIYFNHALVALGALPRLPADVITFPQSKPTYGDVQAPSEPGELLDRIEEIERTLYQVDVMPHRTPEHGPLRRTYAFFEASNWLVNIHLRPLL